MSSSRVRLLGAVLLSACALAQAQAIAWKDSPAVAKLMKQARVKGTFVLHDVASDTYSGYDERRANIRYSPASTFKLANTLIGVTVGAVANVDEVLPYGGKPTFRPEWAHDMSLREAIKVSNVPVYQELARRVGLERMTAQVKTLDYGNMNIGKAVDRFWLDGPLEISALEQTRFLERLAQDRLPFPKEAMAQARDIALQDSTPARSLYGKTGWSVVGKKEIGWFVGWVQKEGKLYSFALNFDIHTEADGDKRKTLALDSLKALGVL